jgi:hypothetical protein
VLSALDAARMSTVGVLLVVGLAVIGLVVAILARAVAIKVLGALLLIGLGALVWLERSDLQDCMTRTKGQAAATGTPGRCRFLGLDVDVKAP